MKNLLYLVLGFYFIFNLTSCRNKTVLLLTKKWDCIQVENILPPDNKFQSPQDSANAVQLQSILQSISWTFKNNMKYECSVNSRITVQGKYELLEHDKILILKPESNNNINRYIITLVTENVLVLSSSAQNTKLVLHFRPS
jgi:hypothetical protein